MKRILWLIVVSFSVSCASLPAKQQAVVSLAASEMALEAAHDAERLLCNPSADQTKAILACSGPQAEGIGLTTARHQQAAVLFSKAFATEIKATNVLKTWKAGDPTPKTVAEYQGDLNAILNLIASTVPRTTDVVTKVQLAIDEAAKIAVIVGAK